MSRGLSSYFGHIQDKLTRSFRPEHWRAETDGAGHDERTRAALAEAVALVAHGRSRSGRQALAGVLSGEPTLSQLWMRTLVRQLNRG
ncbi:hypothetical protein AB1484_35385 [Parafrankia sp. FMc6]|uniref:hypothetical protein n=1 Tax=Parafrankia soli TaxID=2599596 RepID=UPI0034D6565B